MSGHGRYLSFLFVLVREVKPDWVLEQREVTGGTILRTSLTHEQEMKLQAVLSAVKPAADG